MLSHLLRWADGIEDQAAPVLAERRAETRRKADWETVAAHVEPMLALDRDIAQEQTRDALRRAGMLI